MARWHSSSVEVRGLVIYDIKEVEREKKQKVQEDTRDEVNGEVEEVTRNARHTPETRRWQRVEPTTLTFTKCFKSLHKWLGFALYFVTSMSIVLAVTLTHFWPFRVFLVEIQNAKMGLLRCSLYTPRRLQQTAVICKRCNWNKKRTIKTNSWKLFVRGFIQRLNKTGFTVLPYRFACILIYRHFELLWTLPGTTPLPPTGRKNSMIDASADTSWMEWVWSVVPPILGLDGLMYTTLRWSHNDFSISRKKRSSILSKMLLDASVFQIMDQIIFFLFGSFLKTGTMKSCLLNHVVWNWEKVRCFLDDASDRCTFFQETRMCIRRCLHSSMISILCTASWDQSRTIQAAPHCQCPESLSWTSYWTGCRLRFVVGLADEIVGEGDSRSSWQVHEHDSCQLVSQQNVAIHVFWSRCHPRLPLIARDFASRITANNGFLRSIMVCFIFHIEFRAKRSRQTSFPFYHDLGLSSVGLVVNFWTVEQLLHLVLEQLLNPIVSSNHVSKKSLESDEVCRRGWFRSILFDRTSILSVEQAVCDAIHSILMSLPCFPHVLCKTRCFQLDRVKMLVFFVQRIHKQEEYSLSVAQHLWSWCQSWIHDEVWIDCFSYMINVLEDTVRYNDIVLWWRINKIASRMTLVSSEVQSWSWRISEVLLTPPPAAKHLSIVSQFSLWTLVHIQVSQYLIIAVWVSVRFDGYLCCFQRQRNPNHTSNILCKKFSDGRSDINSFWYMTSSDSIKSTVEIQ